MTDRLTQLQICLDQLVEQFNATVNYVNNQSDSALLDDNPMSVTNLAVSAPLPGQAQQNSGSASAMVGGSHNGVTKAPSRAETAANFDNTISELSTDIILKSRQISMLIDSLPGIGVTSESQLDIIDSLSRELEEVEKERVEKIKEKDELTRWCEDLIKDMAAGIAETRQQNV